MQFIAKHGMHELRKWCDDGYKFLQEYDKEVSEKFAIPLSIKVRHSPFRISHSMASH